MADQKRAVLEKFGVAVGDRVYCSNSTHNGYGTWDLNASSDPKSAYAATVVGVDAQGYLVVSLDRIPSNPDIAVALNTAPMDGLSTLPNQRAEEKRYLRFAGGYQPVKKYPSLLPKFYPQAIAYIPVRAGKLASLDANAREVSWLSGTVSGILPNGDVVVCLFGDGVLFPPKEAAHHTDLPPGVSFFMPANSARSTGRSYVQISPHQLLSGIEYKELQTLLSVQPPPISKTMEAQVLTDPEMRQKIFDLLDQAKKAGLLKTIDLADPKAVQELLRDTQDELHKTPQAQTQRDRFLAADKKQKTKSAFKTELGDAGYRIATHQLLSLSQNLIVKSVAVAGGENEHVQALSAILATDVGRSLVSMLLGMGLTYAPPTKNNPKAQRLAREFRIGSMELAGNAVFDSLLHVISPAIVEALNTLNQEGPQYSRVDKSAEESSPDLTSEEEEELIPVSDVPFVGC